MHNKQRRWLDQCPYNSTLYTLEPGELSRYTHYTTGVEGLRFESLQGQHIFSPLQNIQTHSLQLSASSSGEVKNEWSYPSTPPTCLHGVDRSFYYIILVIDTSLNNKTRDNEIVTSLPTDSTSLAVVETN